MRAPVPEVLPDTETWVNPAVGLLARSSASCFAYRLCLTALHGGTCSAAAAFLALTDFDLLDANEDEATRGERRFRLSLAG